MLNPKEERTSVVRSKLLNIMAERLAETLAECMRGGPCPKENQNANDVSPLPPPGGEGALNSSSLDAGTDTPPLQSPLLSISGQHSVLSTPNQRPTLSTPNSSPFRSDKIQKQQSEMSRNSPKLQTDAVLGEPLVASPTPLHDLGVDQEGSVESGKYKSSLAPSERALEKIAKSQAQRVTRRAVVRRPGRSGGSNRGGRKNVHRGSWGATGDEAEEEDGDDESTDPDEQVHWETGDEAGEGEGKDDEKIDSDDGPVAPGQNFSKPSTPGSPYGFTTDSNRAEQSRPYKHSLRLPPPSHWYGTRFLHGTFVSRYPFNPDPGTRR